MFPQIDSVLSLSPLWFTDSFNAFSKFSGYGRAQYIAIDSASSPIHPSPSCESFSALGLPSLANKIALFKAVRVSSFFSIFSNIFIAFSTASSINNPAHKSEIILEKAPVDKYPVGCPCVI
jgi:hypothetical protein